MYIYNKRSLSTNSIYRMAFESIYIKYRSATPDDITESQVLLRS